MPFPIRVLEQQHQGPAAARNLGLANAKGPLVLFLDDDVVPSPRLVAEHARAHGSAENRVVIGTMLEPPGHLQPWVRWESRTVAQQYREMLAGEWAPTPWQFYTGNASVRLEHLRRAGGFDTNYRRAEDVELGLRLARLGLEFIFNVDAAATHIATRSFQSWLDAAYQYGRNDILFGKGEERAAREFRKRHPVTRGLVLWGLRHRTAVRSVWPLAEAAILSMDALGLGALTSRLCSAVFNLRYWLGVADELGSATAALSLAQMASLPGLLSRARSALPIGLRSGRH
jgi:GT2 family glycosyltransferase